MKDTNKLIDEFTEKINISLKKESKGNIETINKLIDIVKNIYKSNKIEWTPYCNIRDELIDLKESLK